MKNNAEIYPKKVQKLFLICLLGLTLNSNVIRGVAFAQQVAGDNATSDGMVIHLGNLPLHYRTQLGENQSIAADILNELTQIAPVATLPLQAPIEEVIDFQIQDSVAYLAVAENAHPDALNRVDIIDLQLPLTPRYRGSLLIDVGRIQCMAVSPDYLALAVAKPLTNFPEELILLVYDQTNHATPRLITQQRLPHGHCDALRIIGDVGYLSVYGKVIALALPVANAVAEFPIYFSLR